MMKHLLTIVLCLTTLTGLAQEEKIKKSEWWNGNPSYAVPIREVNVTARRPMKEIGIQKTQLDTTILHENIALSMADILTFNTSIFVKQYGRATLSTVAFRGTSPSHTQVTWNGMRINSPMLGMTDFSMIPSYFIDDASLLHGTSSVNEAGGGLGGAVKLSTRTCRCGRFQPAIHAGCRLVFDFRRVFAPHLRQRPLANFDTRRLFLLAKRLQVQKLR